MGRVAASQGGVEVLHPVSSGPVLLFHGCRVEQPNLPPGQAAGVPVAVTDQGRENVRYAWGLFSAGLAFAA